MMLVVVMMLMIMMAVMFFEAPILSMYVIDLANPPSVFVLSI